jgi:hypothetical protein
MHCAWSVRYWRRLFWRFGVLAALLLGFLVTAGPCGGGRGGGGGGFTAPVGLFRGGSTGGKGHSSAPPLLLLAGVAGVVTTGAALSEAYRLLRNRVAVVEIVAALDRPDHCTPALDALLATADFASPLGRVMALR